MASSFVLLQQILSGIITATNATNSTAPDAGLGAPQPAPTPMTMPSDISSLITLLFSFSALRDWIKLIIIGGFFETCRRFGFSLYYKLIESFWITAYLDENDSSYDWMMVWLARQSSWNQTRQLEISTRVFGHDNSAVLLPDQEEDENELTDTSGRKIAFLPSVSTTYSSWYKRRWITITRRQQQTGYGGQREETLILSIMTRHHNILNQLLLEAKKEYMSTRQHNISIWVSDISNNWRCAASRPKRPLRSIVLDPGIKDLLVDDARDFLQSKNWYAERGIPFRRGYLLYGAPGSGKTSMIHSMAGELGLDVYVISLSRAGLDDTALSELISELPEKCIALIEDIDAAFHHGVNRDEPTASNTPGTPDDPSKPKAGTPPPSSRLSLSGLLNALDGVGAQEGRILYATTNKYSALDSALCRPGRMDIHVEFKLASQFQARELFSRFYLPTPLDSSEKVEDADKESLDSGYSSSGNFPEGDLETSSISEKSDLFDSSPEVSPIVQPKEPSFIDHSDHKRAPQFSRREITELASQFSSMIPEREFSMASLQGYLMVYKTRPDDAVKDLSTWVEKERADRLAKTKPT